MLAGRELPTACKRRFVFSCISKNAGKAELRVSIAVFIPALDVEVDVQPSKYIHPERLRSHRGFWQLRY
jgi:hypothetical protein